MRITVAIPVYNTADYLPKCLDSVLAQSFGDLEILCIDDGSSDSSWDILESYAAKDTRIRLVKLEDNHGVPYARNLAIDEAQGEYVYFMDSDDWIDSDYLEAMISEADGTGQDVVINCNWYEEHEDGTARKRSGDFGFIKETDGYYSPVSVQSVFYPVVWVRLYRLKYLRDNNIRSPLLKGGVEDNFFTGLAEILQKRSYIFHGPFYHYLQRSGSLVSQPNAGFRHFENFKVFYDELKHRSLPCGCARLFYVIGKLVFDDDTRYDFIRSFFIEIEEEVRSYPILYNNIDIFTLLAVIACPDRQTWLSKYSQIVWVAFSREAQRRGGFPTVEELLKGKWTL